MRPTRDDWLLPTLEGLVDTAALAELRQPGGESLWDTATRRGFTTDDAILAALSLRFRMKVADLASSTGAARDAVPEGLARKYRIVPLQVTDSILDIATADPHDLDCERTLGFATGRTVRMHLAAPSRIIERIEELYRPESAVEKFLEGMTQYDVQSVTDGPDASVDLDLTSEKASERPIIRLVDHIIAEGISQRASDIHMEAQERGVQVHYRIDGVLRHALTLPRAVGIPLVSRIKIISGLDIADRLRPQDGRARVSVDGKRVDLRVSTLPASAGEKVVIRILDSSNNILSLEGLGMSERDFERIQHLVNLREGIVLVTGPTGSGKTTTLYAALRTIQTRGVNIVTVEDPVEYKLTGVVQVQVNEKAGLTFAAALRSILRQDPDVVLVGEIRDRETAGIAIQASLTGHLVLSTLHTIDAASSVARLLDIGVESYKIGAALKGVVAQRLVRRLCVNCRQLTTEPVAERLQRWLPAGAQLCKAVGCAECGHTGYRGRLALMEVLIADGEVERRVSSGETTDKIVEAAKDSGMRSLWESGIDHVLEGNTDLEELLRVVEAPIDQPAPRREARAEPRLLNPTPTSEFGILRQPLAAPPVTPPTRPAPPPSPLARGSILTDDALELVDDLIPTTNSRRAGKSTILLVEDEAPLRLVLRDLLERDGFIVVEAADGIVALDEIDQEAPDAVVLDLNLPRLDGYAVLSRLRSRPNTASLPVIVLTAKGDEDNEVRVFELGANDFLTKPFRPRALTARLRALLRKS
ncbi:MAG: Flp pilus assembly complex ATPase component TadA [Gemmatimonadaceae bacterium]|nr:Flp pilus assembly complex ATPase component TadA [Gemmatimonadaceae bacterium]